MAVRLDVVGYTGLRRFGGYVQEEWHPRLQGRRAAEIYREMADNDAVVGAVLYAIESLVRQVSWRVEPAGTRREQEEARAFVAGCLDDMSHTWQDLLSEILTMLIYGWSYFEVVYKVRGGQVRDPKRRSMFQDGRVGWRKISLRGQDTLDRWEFDEEDGIRGMWQIAPPDYKQVFIPIEKALLFRTRTERNNPEGYSILRRAYRSYYFLKRIQEIEAIGIERDLAGLPVLEVPPEIMHPNASPEQRALRQQLEQLVQDVRRDEREGMVIPSETDPDTGNPTGFRFRLLSTGGSRQIDVNQVIVRYEQRIAMTVLAEFLLLGMDRVGSFALASSKTHLFSVALGAILDSIASVFNRFAIPRLMQLNGYPPEVWPRLEHGDVEAPPLEELGAFLQRTTGVGLLNPDESLERYIRALVGLPQKQVEGVGNLAQAGA